MRKKARLEYILYFSVIVLLAYQFYFSSLEVSVPQFYIDEADIPLKVLRFQAYPTTTTSTSTTSTISTTTSTTTSTTSTTTTSTTTSTTTTTIPIGLTYFCNGCAPVGGGSEVCPPLYMGGNTCYFEGSCESPFTSWPNRGIVLQCVPATTACVYATDQNKPTCEARLDEFGGSCFYGATADCTETGWSACYWQNTETCTVASEGCTDTCSSFSLKIAKVGCDNTAGCYCTYEEPTCGPGACGTTQTCGGQTYYCKYYEGNWQWMSFDPAGGYYGAPCCSDTDCAGAVCPDTGIEPTCDTTTYTCTKCGGCTSDDQCDFGECCEATSAGGPYSGVNARCVPQGISSVDQSYLCE